MPEKNENEYPKMLYREGTEIRHEGSDLDTITVCDDKAEAAARKEGYAELGAKPAAK